MKLYYISWICDVTNIAHGYSRMQGVDPSMLTSATTMHSDR